MVAKKKAPPVKAKVNGRPTKYTDKLADEICDDLAIGVSIRKVCVKVGISVSMFFRYMEDHEYFREQYRRAKDLYGELAADDMQDIADDGRNDWMERLDKEDQPIGWVLNGEHVQRSRLRIDTRKWTAERLRPKVYGNKQQHEHTGPDGGDIPIAYKPKLDGLSAAERKILEPVLTRLAAPISE